MLCIKLAPSELVNIYVQKQMCLLRKVEGIAGHRSINGYLYWLRK